MYLCLPENDASESGEAETLSSSNTNHTDHVRYIYIYIYLTQIEIVGNNVTNPGSAKRIRI